MPTKPLTDDQCREAALVYAAKGSYAAGSDELGLDESTFRHRVKRASERGLMGFAPVLPGFRVSQVSSGPRGDYVQQRPEPGRVFELPPGQAIKGVSALVDPEQRVLLEWIKTVKDRDVDWRVIFEGAFEGFEGRSEYLAPPSNVSHNYINLIPCNDWHINLLCWQQEVGVNWDLKIAEQVIGASIASAIERTPSAKVAVVLGGGDLLHADDNTNRTAKSGNVLEADGRHQKSIQVAQRLKVRTIDAALRKNEQVIVRILQGNHDEYSSVAIAHFLSAWYRNEPRVTVDLDASLFWWYRFGKVLLGATHGHTVKLSQLPSIMAHRRAEDWGLSTFRYAHGFHIHHHSKVATEGEGVICESHEAPIPQDAWHFGSGYISGRCVKTITYHREFGEVSRVRVAIVNHENVIA
jgi:hypothetical protein